MGHNASAMGRITSFTPWIAAPSLAHGVVCLGQLLAEDRHMPQLVLHRLMDGGNDIGQGDSGLEMDLHRDHLRLVDRGPDATAELDHYLL